jgi:SAM-dependent methyltransferase
VKAALLVRPAANRVYGRDAARLLAAELAAVTGVAAERTTIAGLPYLTFDVPDDLAAVAALSATYALFERIDGDELLRPIELPVVDRYDDDLLTTQRYVGRTNETFTRLLVNVGLAAAGLVPGRGHPVVLDPLCGRGTTLNQALTYGGDALGLDVDAKDTQAYATFLTAWLEQKRIKHQLDRTAGRGRFRLTIGRKGAAAEAAADRQVVDVVTGDTTEAVAAFGKGRVDVIAADLPYGVQHGSRTGGSGTGSGGTLARRPDDLLAAALPAWRPVLRPGGAVALSWNTRVLRRDAMVGSLGAAGYEVVTTGPDDAFVHRVDRTITRDVIVARRA